MDVRIYRPAKSAMQSGRAKAQDWVLEYDLKTARKPEDLMGWSSSGDTLNQVKLKFGTLENAVLFAKARGWNYTVFPAHERKVTPKNYVDNFRYIPVEEGASA